MILALCQTVLPHPVPQSRPADPEKASRGGNVELLTHQGGSDERSVELRKIDSFLGKHRQAGTKSVPVFDVGLQGAEIRRGKEITVTNDDGTLDGVSQLTRIAAPALRRQVTNRFA